MRNLRTDRGIAREAVAARAERQAQGAGADEVGKRSGQHVTIQDSAERCSSVDAVAILAQFQIKAAGIVAHAPLAAEIRQARPLKRGGVLWRSGRSPALDYGLDLTPARSRRPICPLPGNHATPINQGPAWRTSSRGALRARRRRISKNGEKTSHDNNGARS